jgi:DNA recombination protein RmuC
MLRSERRSANERVRYLEAHSRQVRRHISDLASKSYWNQFAPAPEFVVMFLPSEGIFSAALERDPSLLEYGVDQRVIVASPTTLIALLRAVAYGWTQEKLARNAQDISQLGRELHDRLASLTGHIQRLGRGLDRAVTSYNDAIGSLESRVLVSARRLREMGAGADAEIATPGAIESRARPLQDPTPVAHPSDPESDR